MAPSSPVVRSKSRLAWLVPGVVAGAALPLLELVYQASTRGLGANPIAEALNRLGLLALALLVLCLACTPLQLWFGWNWPIRARKAIGLLAFGYACLHVLLYVVLDQQLAVRAIAIDIAKRPFILVGFLAWLLLIPLALTSTRSALQRLGFRRWKALHRLVYLCAGLAVVHFVWRVKKDVSEPAAYGLVLGALLLARVVDAARKRRARRPKASPGLRRDERVAVDPGERRPA